MNSYTRTRSRLVLLYGPCLGEAESPNEFEIGVSLFTC
jgi:hypothetical protein